MTTPVDRPVCICSSLYIVHVISGQGEEGDIMPSWCVCVNWELCGEICCVGSCVAGWGAVWEAWATLHFTVLLFISWGVH